MSNEGTSAQDEMAEAKGQAGDGSVLDGELLRKLEEQNRLLESDSRYKKIVITEEITRGRTQSSPSFKPHNSVPSISQSEATPTSSTTLSPEERSLSHFSMSSLEPMSADEEAKQLSTWGDVMKNWEETSKKNFKLIRSLICRGIPGPLRGMVWQLLASQNNQELKEQYPSLITETSPFEKSIQRDLARTFPEHPLFKEKDGIGQESLFNLTKAYSLYDREVGYCQGSLFIAGILLMNMPEEDAFCVFVHMMNQHRLRELYKPTMADLSVRFYQLGNLVEELFPRLDIHFRALGFHTSMYSSSWFLTLFASTLPLCAAFRIIDIFLTEGMEIIFRVGLALLERSHDQLLQLDMEDMTKHFQKEMKSLNESDCDHLFDIAFRLKLSSKKLKKLEKEFVQKKEKQSAENSELIRLQSDNVELEKRIIALEKECAALADRLIQGQVTRAQEYEEMYGVRKELNALRKKVASYERNESTKPKSRSTTPELHPLKIFASTDIRERSISAPSLRDATLKIYNNSVEKIKEENAAVEQQKKEYIDQINDSQLHDIEELLKELARVKIELADSADVLERKSLELRQLHQKHGLLQVELEEARDTIDRLRQEKDTAICSHCKSTITNTHSTIGTAHNLTGSSSSKQEIAMTTGTTDDVVTQFADIIAGLDSVLEVSKKDLQSSGSKKS